MDAVFVAHVEALRPKLEHLLRMTPVTPQALPKDVPKAGIYLLSEGDRHLYVGRSNGLRARIRRHCRPSASHRMGAFAFRLAREATGQLQPTYKKGDGSRSALAEDPAFLKAFVDAKARIRLMDLRYVEEGDPVRQCLLEVYAAVVLATPYNDFDNH
jgi:uncharacterized protein (UPF0297 family)